MIFIDTLSYFVNIRISSKSVTLLNMKLVDSLINLQSFIWMFPNICCVVALIDQNACDVINLLGYIYLLREATVTLQAGGQADRRQTK